MTKNKKGSALLIVIGFLSFMIVSAVAFAIYMRAERLPSSALRRTVATRHLAKAALAEAISRIDDSVRGAPFPGLNDQDSRNYRPRGGTENFWEGGRVFMPPNAKYGGGNQQHYAPADETVSVMTLEGLGYVPPPLVNDARFLGRATWTAQWSNLPYDAGRYAFVALNVSDFFDINRVWANKPRTSNADGRLSLAYLLDPNYKPMASTSPGQTLSTSLENFQGGAKQFDNMMHDSREAGNDSNAVGKEAPFVSNLDYQLAMKNGISSTMPSLFYSWIHDQGSDRTYYAEGDQNHYAAGRQPFVTESCQTNEAWDVDIAYYQAATGKKQKGQPFDSEVKQDNATLMQVAMSRVTSSKFFTAILQQKGGGEIKFADGARGTVMMATMMYDYLDHNDIPLSLAWPCVERVPMLAAIEPAFKFNIPAVQAQTAQTTTTWNFDANQWLQAGMVSAVWAFPFKRNANDRNDTYKAQAILRVFLAPDGLTLRAAEGLGQLLRPRDKGEWTQKGQLFQVGGQSGVFCLTFQLGEQAINIPNQIRDDNEAGNVINFPVNIGALGNAAVTPLVTCVEEKDPKNPSVKQKKYTVSVSPLGLDGKPMFQVGQQLDEATFNAAAGQNLRAYAAVWMRIVNSDNKTVDLVPAVIQDDQTLNNMNSTVPTISEYLLQESDGPLLRFQGSQTFSYAGMVQNQATGGQSEWSPSAFCTVDPRFNWAPEDWYSSEAGITTFDRWLDKTNKYLESGFADNMGCDPDIFCAVSNQGFLQSLGEFAFLPRVTDFYNGGLPRLAMRQAAGGYDGRVRSSAQEIANRQCAWCTYDMNWEVYEAFEAAGIGRSTNRECLVNPYTPSRDIFMAALANSPTDYWAAGTALDPDENELKTQLGDDTLPEIKDASQGLKYAFCQQNQEARLTCKELLDIASNMQSALTNFNNISQGRSAVGSRQTADAWKWIWDEKLDWMPSNSNPDFNRFLGVQLADPLYSIDRKFLRSYWRDCFGDQQQLFLVFVRAESSAIGGPGEGTPAQKGARAVALVWRNPTASIGGSRDGAQDDRNTGWLMERRPHQTRVLFYHQFD